MTLLELSLLGLSMIALIGMGISLGATIMWRLVHRTEPPPLPMWVSLVTVASLGLFALVAVVAENWLTALSTGLFGAVFGAMGLAYERRRRSGGDEST